MCHNEGLMCTLVHSGRLLLLFGASLSEPHINSTAVRELYIYNII